LLLRRGISEDGMLNECLIIEHSSHFHAVHSWVKIINTPNIRIFLPLSLQKNMLDFNKSYLSDVEIIDIKNLIRSIIKHFLKFKSRPNLIITTPPEHIMGAYEIACMVLYILFKPKVLCVLNPKKWKVDSYYSGNQRIRTKYLDLISRSLLKKLYFKSDLVVCESSLQLNYLYENLGVRDNVKFFPGRLSDVYPSNLEKNNIECEIIGILGSVDIEKRDYQPIIRALSDIPIENRPKIAFLGAVKQNSMHIIDEFRKLGSDYFYSQNFVDEDTFFNLGRRCSILIAPLRKEINYGSECGTGSFADAVALRKVLLVPKHIPIPEEFKDFVLHYQNLKTYIDSTKSVLFVNNPNVEHKFDKFNLFNVKEYLQLNF
jgi:hypothetical protein